MYGAGPALTPTIAQGAVLTAIVTPILFPRPIGNLLLLSSVGVYGVVVAIQPGNPAPGVQWVFVAIQAGLVTILVSGFSRLVSGMVEGEQRARARAEATLQQLHIEDERKRSFLARMSHELRTPLNAVIGFSTLLQYRAHVGDLNPRQAEYLDDIAASGQHLLGLVDDLLDITLVERGGVGLVTTTFPAGRVISDSVTLCRQQAANGRVNLVTTPIADLGEIEADERRTRQILLNVIANAVAVTPEGGSVTVRARRFGHRIEVSVTDTGPGIAPADHERIFAAYEQGRSVRQGTGLGLALARKFAESQGGRLTVDSALGRGATFQLVLPVSAADHRDVDLGDVPTAVKRGSVGLWDAGGALEQLVGAEAQHRFIARVAAYMLAGEAAALLALVLLPRPGKMHSAGIWPILGVAVLTMAWLLRPRARLSPRTTYAALYPTVLVLGLVTWLAGAGAAPTLGSAFVATGIFSFLSQSLRRAIPLGVLIAVAYAGALLALPDTRAPAMTWALTMALMSGGIALVLWLVQFVPNLAQAEHAARGKAEQTNERLQAASRHKTEFLANMSHELRTPLNAILGFSQVLADEAVGPLNDRQLEYIGDILNAGRHLLALINDILDLAKADAGRLELMPRRHRASAVMNEAVASHLRLARERHVKVEVSVTPSRAELDVDAEQLGRAVSCLVANAVEYTPETGRVTLAAIVGSGGATITVTDTGPGIDPVDQERVFSEFEQAQSAGAGTGIGLALARRLVNLHGGTLNLTSAVRRGSEFTIRLPAACVSPNPMQPLPAASQPA
jgi:signal transduction histidine kinase